MHPYAIAEQLRARGHDVVAAAETGRRRGTPDRELFAIAQVEKRAIVSDDTGFGPIEAEPPSALDACVEAELKLAR